MKLSDHFRKRSVLLVDDDHSIHNIIDLHLENVVDEIVHAVNGYQALDILKRRSFNLVLLDIELPDMDGVQVCKAIRTMPSCKDTPVVMVSVRDNAFQMAQALDAGADAYVNKPLNPIYFQACVRSAVRKSEYQIDMKNSLRREKISSLKRDILPLEMAPYMASPATVAVAELRGASSEGLPQDKSLLHELNQMLAAVLPAESLILDDGDRRLLAVSQGNELEEQMIEFTRQAVKYFKTAWKSIDLYISIGTSSQADCTEMDTITEEAAMALERAVSMGGNRMVTYSPKQRVAS